MGWYSPTYFNDSRRPLPVPPGALPILGNGRELSGKVAPKAKKKKVVDYSSGPDQEQHTLDDPALIAPENWTEQWLHDLQELSAFEKAVTDAFHDEFEKQVQKWQDLRKIQVKR